MLTPLAGVWGGVARLSACGKEGKMGREGGEGGGKEGRPASYFLWLYDSPVWDQSIHALFVVSFIPDSPYARASPVYEEPFSFRLRYLRHVGILGAEAKEEEEEEESGEMWRGKRWAEVKEEENKDEDM